MKLENQLIVTFQTSPNIIFGNNAIENVAEILNKNEVRRLLIITDKGVINSGYSIG